MQMGRVLSRELARHAEPRGRGLDRLFDEKKLSGWSTSRIGRSRSEG
jgi:hypothetical protein